MREKTCMRIIQKDLGRDPLYKIWNTTDEYMIIYFESDGGSLLFSDAIYPIEKGGLCFIAAGNLHYTMPDDPQKYLRSKIYITAKTMRSLLDSVSRDSDFYRLYSESGAVYASIQQEDRALVDKMFSDALERFCKSGREDGIIASFFYLMTLISDRAVGHSSSKTPESFMARAISYINSVYSEEISLDELCRVVNMSKSHFCRKFKAAMGITVMDYIFTTRIAAAKRLLSAGVLSISQISERCGFSSVSYFCQKFKEETGITANEFKRAAMRNSLPLF